LKLKGAFQDFLLTLKQGNVRGFRPQFDPLDRQPLFNHSFIRKHECEWCVIYYGSKNEHQKIHVFERDHTMCSKYDKTNRETCTAI
jgi:hypothetical protein